MTAELCGSITVSASRSIASLSPYGIATSRSTPMKTFVVVCGCRALPSLHSLRQQEHRHFVTIWHHLVSQSPPAGASPLCHHMASPPVGAPPSRLLYWYVTREFCRLLGGYIPTSLSRLSTTPELFTPSPSWCCKKLMTLTRLP